MTEDLSATATTAVETVTALATEHGLRVIYAVIILIIGFMAAGWIARFVSRSCEKTGKIDSGVSAVLAKIVKIGVIAFTIISVLKHFGFETTSLIALIGAAGLAIGLALQGTLTNVASGVLIMIFRPFTVGQVIDVGGRIVIIDDIGLFITRGHVPDGMSIILPNSSIWGNVITNLSVTFNDQRRINESFGISYSDDMGKAIALVKQVLDADERVLKDPEYRVAIGALGDSSVDILVHAWTQRADWFPAKLDLNRKIKEAFDANGISIPFPQRDVHLYTENGGGAKG